MSKNLEDILIVQQEAIFKELDRLYRLRHCPKLSDSQKELLLSQRKAFVKQMNNLYKRGYFPQRGNQSYFEFVRVSDKNVKNKINAYSIINCVGHSFFNLKNEDIDMLAQKSVVGLHEIFSQFPMLGLSPRKIINNIYDFVRVTGLKIEKTNLEEKIEDNQWKVAVYFVEGNEFERDYHFMIEEKNGKWTSKIGTSALVETLDKPPELYRGEYELMEIVKITNPYIELDREGDIE